MSFLSLPYFALNIFWIYFFDNLFTPIAYVYRIECILKRLPWKLIFYKVKSSGFIGYPLHKRRQFFQAKPLSVALSFSNFPDRIMPITNIKAAYLVGVRLTLEDALTE